MMDYISLVILGCAVVTFIPRLIPALFIDKLDFPPKAEKFLNLIPYTALAAVICPGVLTVDNQLWYIGLIGAVVTFIPRLIPALFIDKLDFPPKAEKFLNLIPYTALAALICPGVLTVDNQLWYIGLIGAVVAAGLAWKKVPLGAIVILTVVVLITVYSIVPFF